MKRRLTGKSKLDSRYNYETKVSGIENSVHALISQRASAEGLHNICRFSSWKRMQVVLENVYKKKTHEMSTSLMRAGSREVYFTARTNWYW